MQNPIFLPLMLFVSRVATLPRILNGRSMRSWVHFQIAILLALCLVSATRADEVLARERSPAIGKLVNLEEHPGSSSLLVATSTQEEMAFQTPEFWEFDAFERQGRLEAGRLLFPRLRQASHHRYTDYKQEESAFSYVPGSGDDLGWIDFESSHYLESGYRHGFSTGIGLHLLAGPRVVDAPPRLYDFTFGYQRRDAIGDTFSYDVAASVGVYSDFEGSAREGIRFPGHAVGIFHASPETDWVFGLDYLDRDDIKILPVFGVSRHSDRHPSLRFDLIFPRPQVEMALQSGRTVYVAGRLGGNSWDMEFPNQQEDVLTYRDYRVLLGLKRSRTSSTSNIEVGYLFDRKMSFREFSGQADPGGAFILRFVSTK